MRPQGGGIESRVCSRAKCHVRFLGPAKPVIPQALGFILVTRSHGGFRQRDVCLGLVDVKKRLFQLP